MPPTGNQGGGGRGPRIPRNLKPDLEQVNSVLTDISTKLANMYELDKTFTVNVEVKNMDKFEKLERDMKRAAKVNEALAKSLGARAKAELQIKERMNENAKKIQKIVDKTKLLNDLSLKREKLQKAGVKMDKAEEDALRRLEAEEDSLVDQMVELQKAQAAQEASLGNLSSKWGTFAKVLGNQVLGALDRVGIGLTTLALDAVFFSLEKVKDGFLKVFDLMERTTKATGQFNNALGGTTKGLDKTRAEAMKVEGQLRSLTGGELGVGLQMWEETSLALGFVGKGFDQMATKATLAGRALGIGSQAAGELARTFSLVGEGAERTTKSLVEVSDAANDAGVQVSSFGKEINASKGFLASFGKMGRKVFLDSAAFARRLGVSLASLERFTDMTDTFQSTAEAAAKMNTVFGTSVNAMELMLEQDPSKRLEMVRRELSVQGKTWEGMNRQERKFFAQTMQLSEEEAAGVMESNLTLEEFQAKQAKAKAKQVSDEQKIRDGLAKTAETLFNFGQAWDGVSQAIAGLIKPFLQVFGLVKETGKAGKGFGGVMKEAFGTLTGFINSLAKDPKVQKMIKDWATDFKDLAMRVKDFVTSGRLKQWVDEAVKGVGNMYDAIKNVAQVLDEKVFTKENMDMARKIFGFIADNIDKIVGGFLALKTIIGVATVFSGISSLVALLGGAGGLLSMMSGLAAAIAPVVTGFISIAAPIAAVAVALGAAAAAGYAFGTKLREWFPEIDKKAQGFLDEQSKTWTKLKTVFSKEARDEEIKKGKAELDYAMALAKDKADRERRMEQGAKASFIHLAPPATAKAVPQAATTAVPNAAAQGPVNYAAKAKEEAKTKKNDVNIVAGDVYLDGNLVGRHIGRQAFTNQ